MRVESATTTKEPLSNGIQKSEIGNHENECKSIKMYMSRWDEQTNFTSTLQISYILIEFMGVYVFYYSRQTAFCLYRSLKISSVCSNIEILLDRPIKEVNLMKELFA